MIFHTRLPIEECKARLAAGIDPERLGFTWSGYAGSKPILGKLHGDSFRLQKRRYYKNDLAPHFFGRFVAVGRDTRVEGEFKINRLGKFAMIGWFSLLGLLMLLTLVGLATGWPRVDGDPAITVLIYLGLAAFGLALIRFSRWLARGEERAIVAFLKATLEANDAGSPEPIG
jgi:hypothetical protein